MSSPCRVRDYFAEDGESMDEIIIDTVRETDKDTDDEEDEEDDEDETSDASSAVQGGPMPHRPFKFTFYLFCCLI
jgi:hypothetical protein